MASITDYLEQYEKKKKAQGGFNAPAPLGSVVDTIGQEPQVQSPFGQQAGLDAISRDCKFGTNRI